VKLVTSVNAKCIKGGAPRCAWACPIAIAVWNAWSKHVGPGCKPIVIGDHVTVHHHRRWTAKLTPRLQAFKDAYDAGKDVAPMRATLTFH